MYKHDTPYGWKEIGGASRIILKRNSLFPVITTGSGHLHVIPKDERFLMRSVMFEGKGARIVDDIYPWTKDELMLAFDLGTDSGLSDRKFARERDAEFGIKDRFARAEDRLVIYCQDLGGYEWNHSVCVSPSIKRGLAKFLDGIWT